MNQYNIRSSQGSVILTTDAHGTILTINRKRWRKWVGHSIVDFRRHLENKAKHD